MNKPFLLRWFCPNCNVEHDELGDLDTLLNTQRELLQLGVLMTAMYDGTYAEMCEQDRAEARAGLTD